MIYGRFASVYDELMKDVPYDKWVHFIQEKSAAFQASGTKLLDLACGTGELSVRFAKEGYEVTGIDLSAEMLAVAENKASEQGARIMFFQQDMTELELVDKYDIVGIFCDSLNYLPTAEAVKRTFARVYQYLHEEGLFIFDVHSLYKINEVFRNQTFTYDQGDICYIWHCYEGEAPNSVEHDLTFFVETSGGMFERFDEWHTQRTFSIEDYKNWLEGAGFEVLEVSGDFHPDAPKEDAERIFFTARKK